LRPRGEDARIGRVDAAEPEHRDQAIGGARTFADAATRRPEPCKSCPHAEGEAEEGSAGRCSIHTLLLDPPEYIETAKVFDMLLAVPKYGRVKVNKVLTQCRISPSKTIGGLSERQRDELVRLLRR